MSDLKIGYYYCNDNSIVVFDGVAVINTKKDYHYKTIPPFESMCRLNKYFPDFASLIECMLQQPQYLYHTLPKIYLYKTLISGKLRLLDGDKYWIGKKI